MRTLHVAGTVHTPSSMQQAEVATLIESTRPDVVLVELDQPRLEALLEQHEREGTITFGSDLLQAVQSARVHDIPVVLGDVILPLDALWQARPFINGGRLWRACKLAAPAPIWQGVSMQRVAISRTFAADPIRAAPLAASIALTASITLLVPSPGEVQWVISAASSSLLALLSVGALLRFVDVMLLSRDEVLGENALRALEIGSGLRSGRFARRTFTFSTCARVLAEQNAALLGPYSSEGRGVADGRLMPFLTLRSPLQPGEVRRVNLFEPRWLAMMDLVAKLPHSRQDNGEQYAGGAPSVAPGTMSIAFANSTSTAGNTAPVLSPIHPLAVPSSQFPVHPLAGCTFGTMHVVNRFYYPAGRDAAGDIEADLVVNPREARRARVLRAEEGERPVSGARRLAVWIQGEEALDVQPPSVRPAAGGFLLGTIGCGDEHGGIADGTDSIPVDAGDPERQPSSKRASVVGVVGLAHANGVLAYAAERRLRSAVERGGVDAEVARALRERKAAAALEGLAWDDFDRGLEKLI